MKELVTVLACRQCVEDDVPVSDAVVDPQAAEYWNGPEMTELRCRAGHLLFVRSHLGELDLGVTT